MRTIWKYQIPHEGLEVPISRPVVVLVGIDPANPDSDTPSIWLEHDEYMTIHPTRFHFIGTGHPVSMTAHHVGSCITRHGLVWHVYREDADSEAHELAAARAAAGLLADPTISPEPSSDFWSLHSRYVEAKQAYHDAEDALTALYPDAVADPTTSRTDAEQCPTCGLPIAKQLAAAVDRLAAPEPSPAACPECHAATVNQMAGGWRLCPTCNFSWLAAPGPKEDD